jgi:hypothetical protein
MARLRNRAVAVGLAVMVTALSGCQGSGPSIDDLLDMPAAGLAYPSSIELARDQRDAETSVVAKNPAALRVFRCAEASSAVILTWFNEQLAADGWAAGRDEVDVLPGSAYEGPTHSWRKAKHRFVLRFLTADRAAALAQQQGKACPGTGYETRLS